MSKIHTNIIVDDIRSFPVLLMDDSVLHQHRLVCWLLLY